MKVTLCAIGRGENSYAVEFVEYYKKIGFSKIFIYDNNFNGEEHFEDVLSPFIDEGFVEIVDWRNRKGQAQAEAYMDCYAKHGNECDWMAFFDFDEFLTFNEDKGITTVDKWLSIEGFKDTQLIRINWMVYGDCGHLTREEGGVLERFTTPLPQNFSKNSKIDGFLTFDNWYVKCIVRGKLPEVKFERGVHVPSTKFDHVSIADGSKYSKSAFTSGPNYDVAWIRHFTTKSLEEYIDVKVKRGGFPDNVFGKGSEYFKRNDFFHIYYTYNRETIVNHFMDYISKEKQKRSKK